MDARFEPTGPLTISNLMVNSQNYHYNLTRVQNREIVYELYLLEKRLSHAHN